MKKYSDFFKGKERRVLLTNFFSLFSLQIVGYFFPLITMPYLARVIGVEGFGAVALALSIISYFQSFTDWGFKYTAVREIAQNRDNIEKISQIFSNVIFSRIFLMMISIILLSILTLFVPLFRYNSIVIWVTFLLIPGHIIFPDWFFQAMEEMKYITIMNFISKLIFTLLVFVFIKKTDDFVLEPLISACGYFVSGSLSFVYAVRHFRISILLPRFSDIFHMLKNGRNMFFAQFLPTLYNNLSILLLGTFGGKSATGLFSSGYKFIGISDQFSQVIFRTFFPFLARRMDKHKSFRIISGSISVVMCILLFISADILVGLFYTPTFSEASKVIRIMAISPFFLYLMNAYGTNGLVIIGKEKVLKNIILVCSVFGCILSIFATYYWNYIGVAYTLVSVWGIRGLLTYYYAIKYRLDDYRF